MTMRRGGPHPCLPGVPFVILTLHSGMEGKTERKEYTQRKVERDREGGEEERERAEECVCAEAWRYSTHTRREREAGRGKKPLDPAILSQR